MQYAMIRQCASNGWFLMMIIITNVVFLIFSPFEGDKVSILTHTYPHKP